MGAVRMPARTDNLLSMPEVDPLFLLAGLIGLGVLAQWIAARFRLPAIVILLATGLLVGPGLGLIDPDKLFGDLMRPMVGLAVAIVLFEGGLSLHFKEARRLGAPLYALVFGGLVLTFGVGSALAHYVAGLSWAVSCVLAAILVVTGPTVIKPMLRSARLARRPALLLKWEGIVNDPLGALLAVLALQVAVAQPIGDDWNVTATLGPILPLILAAGVLGGLAGWFMALALARNWITEHLKVPAFVAAVVVVYASCDALFHEAGLLAVTAMGIVLANRRLPSLEAVRHFKEDITTLLVSFLFIVLSARLSLSDLAVLTGPALLFVVAVLFVLRPLAAGLSLAPTGLPWREVFLIGWIAPRGVVAAAMAAALQPRLLEAGYEDARLLLPIVFAIIVLTVVLHGITLGPLARGLGLASTGGGGLLIVGISSWSLELARTLQEKGIHTVVVDSHFRAIARARVRGAEAVYGDVLSSDTLDDLPFEELTWVLAAGADHDYNDLVGIALSRTFGREHVFTVTPAEDEERAEHLSANAPWGELGTYASLSARHWSKRPFKTTLLTDAFSVEAFREKQPEAIVLFAIRDGQLRLVGDADQPGSGDMLLYQA